MRMWRALVPLYLICSMAFGSESRLPFNAVFKGQEQFNRLVAKAKAGNWKGLPIGERTAAVGQALLGRLAARQQSPRSGRGSDSRPRRAQRPTFGARDEHWLAALPLSGGEPVVARSAWTNGSECFIAAALSNSKKPGRSH